MNHTVKLGLFVLAGVCLGVAIRSIVAARSAATGTTATTDTSTADDTAAGS